MSRLRRAKAVEEEALKNREALTSADNVRTTQECQERSKSGFIAKLVKITFIIFLVFLTFYFGILLIMYTSYTVRHQVVYLNYLVNPFVNYSNPGSRGISNTKNFYIQGEDGQLGVWHVQAKDSSSINDGKPIVLYMHGNAYSRNAMHRISMYKVLSSLGCHVVAFDYRGFGDSDGYPTEKGLTVDGLTAFNWIRDKAKHSSIYLWGHSLGSAVAISVVSELNKAADSSITGLILEAPFNNMKEAAIGHPLSRPFKFFPNFQEMLQEINYLFKSDEMIINVHCHILILHDHEDVIVNFALGKKLYNAALKSQGENQSIELKEFRGFGHNYIYKSEELQVTLRTFLKLCSEHRV